MGLSITTGSRASSAANPSGTWVRFGDATTTRSSSAARCHSASTSSSRRASGFSALARARRSGSRVTITPSDMPGVDEISGPWKIEPARP
jgi:hypothetical protein